MAGDLLDTRKREKSWKEIGVERLHSRVQNGKETRRRREGGRWGRWRWGGNESVPAPSYTSFRVLRSLPRRSVLLSRKDSPLASLRVGHADGLEKEPAVTGELVGSCTCCWLLLTTQLVPLLATPPAADTDIAAHPADRFQMTVRTKDPHNIWPFASSTP